MRKDIRRQVWRKYLDKGHTMPPYRTHTPERLLWAEESHHLVRVITNVRAAILLTRHEGNPVRELPLAIASDPLLVELWHKELADLEAGEQFGVVIDGNRLIVAKEALPCQ